MFAVQNRRSLFRSALSPSRNVSANIGNVGFSTVGLVSERDASSTRNQQSCRLRPIFGKYFHYWGYDLAVDMDEYRTKAIQYVVEGFVDRLLEELGRKEPQLAASKLGIDSFYNGTKKNTCG